VLLNVDGNVVGQVVDNTWILIPGVGVFIYSGDDTPPFLREEYFANPDCQGDRYVARYGDENFVELDFFKISDGWFKHGAKCEIQMAQSKIYHAGSGCDPEECALDGSCINNNYPLNDKFMVPVPLPADNNLDDLLKPPYRYALTR